MACLSIVLKRFLYKFKQNGPKRKTDTKSTKSKKAGNKTGRIQEQKQINQLNSVQKKKTRGHWQQVQVEHAEKTGN